MLLVSVTSALGVTRGDSVTASVSERVGDGVRVGGRCGVTEAEGLRVGGGVFVVVGGDVREPVCVSVGSTLSDMVIRCVRDGVGVPVGGGVTLADSVSLALPDGVGVGGDTDGVSVPESVTGRLRDSVGGYV